MTSVPSIMHGVSMRPFNTFGVEARASSYLEVRSPAVLADAIAAGLLQGRRLVLGGGSNLLLLGDFDGLIVHMLNTGIEISEEKDAFIVKAAAGENWHEFVQWTLGRGMPGLENLSLIPGSVGAAPIQNIGAYGAEAGEFIRSVTIMDLDTGDISALDAGRCRFAYRDSIFKHELKDRVAILDVTFTLPREWKPKLGYADVKQEAAARGWGEPDARQIAEAVIAIRRRKLPDPAVLGNAGSFFKNPVVCAEKRNVLLASHPALVSYPQQDGSWKLAAGWLIDQCGWKGKRIGDAGVYDKQALVLVNHGSALGKDILHLAECIRRDVFDCFGVQLEPEPVFA